MAEFTYKACVAQNAQELASAPSGPHMINLAREAVREVCKSLHLLRKRQEFDWNEEGEYMLDHTGYSMVEIRGIWFDEVRDEYRLDSTYQNNLELRDDVSLWRLEYPDLWYAKPEKVIVSFTFMPKVTSDSFPLALYDQHAKLLRLGFLRNVGSYIRLHDGRSAVNQWEPMYQAELINERARQMQGLGPDYVRPFFGGYEDIVGEWR